MYEYLKTCFKSCRIRITRIPSSSGNLLHSISGLKQWLSLLMAWVCVTQPAESSCPHEACKEATALIGLPDLDT